MGLTFRTLGDFLTRRYVKDYIGQAQQLSSPVYSMLPEDTRYAGRGEGAYFAIDIDGNESGIGWRGTDDNSLPSAGNERVKQHRVRPKKLYGFVEFSGLAEEVSRGDEDAFANGVAFQIQKTIRRMGAVFETTFLRGDGTGRLTNVNGAQTSVTSVSVDDARPFRSGQVIEFLNNSTGVKQAGPVQVTDKSIANGTITVTPAVTVSDDDGVYIAGEQSGAAPPAEVTALGLPAIINNTGTIYNLSRTTYPILQSSVINASSTALDEALLRRLRRQIEVQTDVGFDGGTNDFIYVTNYEQYDRYTEISLGHRRFNDMTLDLGAQRAKTTFEGRPWVLSWAALPDEIFTMRMGAIVRGTVRPLSIDERVNAEWIPGQDSFGVLLKYYGENVARNVNQTGRIQSLTTPTF